jgi:drug/metabolite transporter (DMT)-like permease
LVKHHGRVTRRAAFLFIALGLAWGIPYFLIKVAVGELPPSTLVLARTALAALILLPIALARSEVAAVLRHWRPVLAYTVVEIVLPWIFLSRAEQRTLNRLLRKMLEPIEREGATGASE